MVAKGTGGGEVSYPNMDEEVRRFIYDSRLAEAGEALHKANQARMELWAAAENLRRFFRYDSATREWRAVIAEQEAELLGLRNVLMGLLPPGR